MTDTKLIVDSILNDIKDVDKVKNMIVGRMSDSSDIEILLNVIYCLNTIAELKCTALQNIVSLEMSRRADSE